MALGNSTLFHIIRPPLLLFLISLLNLWSASTGIILCSTGIILCSWPPVTVNWFLLWTIPWRHKLLHYPKKVRPLRPGPACCQSLRFSLTPPSQNLCIIEQYLGLTGAASWFPSLPETSPKTELGETMGVASTSNVIAYYYYYWILWTLNKWFSFCCKSFYYSPETLIGLSNFDQLDRYFSGEFHWTLHIAIQKTSPF